MRALPPTHLLATFDALIRLRSFRQAADELGLSPSTVSHRLGELEALLGLALFTRTTRSVSPTADGADLHSQIKDPLAALERAFTRRAPRREVVRISALPSFARFCLMPALARLRAAGHPPAVEIAPGTQLVDVDKGEADVAVRFARDRPPAARCEKLMDDEWFPVASPAYLARLGIGPGAGWQRHAALLAHARQPWQPWFEHAGLAMPEAAPAYAFTDTGLLLDAALASQGVALGRRSLVGGLLADGSLVRLSAVALPCEQAYWLLTGERAAITPQGQAVVRWIRSLVQDGEHDAGQHAHDGQ